MVLSGSWQFFCWILVVFGGFCASYWWFLGVLVLFGIYIYIILSSPHIHFMMRVNFFLVNGFVFILNKSIPQYLHLESMLLMILTWSLAS